MTVHVSTHNAERATLAAIVTTARAGSLNHAWRLFHAAGYDQRTDDPAALAVKGRLLKDRARLADPADQPAGYDAAAAAYAAADRLARQPYLMINVATLTWLAGHRDDAQHLARTLLAWLDRDEAIAETPYYLLATRAEALLICGEVEAARAALGRAIACDPNGWVDHASTIRQLELILSRRGGDAGWLDAFRPPRALHFAGHLGVAVEGSEALARKVDALIAQAGIGFGFGALAAGADIVIAECLLAAGGELHVILPSEVETFVQQSVAPYAPEWRTRFERCLAQAQSVQSLTSLRGAYQPLATRLAAEVAMGSAIRQAHRLATEAVQIVVIDDGPGPYGTGVETGANAERWASGGHRHYVIPWARNAPVTASGLKTEPEGSPDLRLAAMLHIDFPGIDAIDDEQFADTVVQLLDPFRHRSLAIPVQPDLVLPCGNARIVAFTQPEAAFAYAQALFAMALPGGALPGFALRIAGHYALAHWLDSPPALVGRALADLARISGSAIPGVLTVSETFASALQIVATDDIHVEHVGEGATGQLFSVHVQGDADGPRVPASP